MRVLIIDTSDSVGGAARAAHRLFEALLSVGCDCHMLVRSKTIDHPSIHGLTGQKGLFQNKLKSKLDQYPVKRYKNRDQSLFSPNFVPSDSILKKNDEINPDIIKLHWMAGGFLKIEDIGKLKQPLFGFLRYLSHHMWVGHYFDTYRRFEENYAWGFIFLKKIWHL